MFESLNRANNLRHQRGDKTITATVPFVRIYAKLTNSAKCIGKSLCAQNMSIFVLSSTKITISLHILILVDTSTDHPQIVSVIQYM